MKIVVIGFNKISDVGEKDALKKSKYNADNLGLITKIEGIDEKILDTSNLVSNRAFNTNLEKLKIKYQILAD